MIKFTKRQTNTLLNALNRFYNAQMNTKFCNTDESVDIYVKLARYLNGITDALDIMVVQDTTGSYSERFHIYTAEGFLDAMDNNGNNIEIMTIDALTKTIIYDIFKETDTYSVKYARQLQEGLAKYYKENYGEQLILP